MEKHRKTRAAKQNIDSMMEFEEHELRNTMEEFLEEEKKANTNIWNFATITGIALFFVGMMYAMQMIGLSPFPDVSGMVEIAPLIGGILVTLIGFGFFVGDRKAVKRHKKKQKQKEKERISFEWEEEEDAGEDAFSLENDLGTEPGFRKRSGRRSQSLYDSYALGQSRKLYKSRTDKKWAGVCGGLAKYFGISSTAIRFLFVFTFFAGSGTSLLVYIALAIALEKEPADILDEY